MYMLKLKIQAAYLMNVYKFKHFVFSWNQDEEGDIVFSLCKLVHFIKYKEHTIVKFGNKGYQPAPKYVKEN